MAGEYKIAETFLQDAIQIAAEENGMSEATMMQAFLTGVLQKLATSHSRKQLDEMIAFHLNSMGEDEFVVTRGC